MPIDINAKAAQLLERLANSIYDREPKALQDVPFTFRTQEIHVVENWINELLQEAFRLAGEY